MGTTIAGLYAYYNQLTYDTVLTNVIIFILL